MVDIHCHILNGIDDGPKDLEHSLSLCRKLYQKGVRSIIATPHYIIDDSYMPEAGEVKEKVQLLQAELDKEKLDLKLYHGMEVFASRDIIEKIRGNEILTLNDSKYILIEFSFGTISRYVSDLLFELQLEGLTPIIAHPERYSSGFIKSKLLSEFVDKGILLQINSESISGFHGKRAKKAAYDLLRRGMVHFVASDSHGEDRVLSNVWDVEEKISKICGTENAERIIHYNTQQILDNKDVLKMNKVKKHFIITGLLKKLRVNV